MYRVTIGEHSTTTTTVVLTVASLGEVVRGPASDHGVPGLLLTHHRLTGQPPPPTVTVPAAVLSSAWLAVTEPVVWAGLGWLLPEPLLLVQTGVLSL